jgi:hypothetical protein
MNETSLGREEMEDLANRIKNCLEEAGIDADLHLGPGFSGVTALAKHRDGSTIQISVKIVAGEQHQGVSSHGVSSDRFDSALARSVPTLMIGGRTASAGGGPVGASQDDQVD